MELTDAISLIINFKYFFGIRRKKSLETGKVTPGILSGVTRIFSKTGFYIYIFYHKLIQISLLFIEYSNY